MFNIPLASPFCIIYRTGLPPNPSSLNASNIRTLLAHRFHLLKLLVIINYIFIFVKRTLSFIILKPFPLILAKNFLFLSRFAHILISTLLGVIYFVLSFLTVNLLTSPLLHIKNLNTIHMSHHIYLQSHLEFFCELWARSPSRNCYIKQTTMNRCWKVNITTFRICNNIY